MHLDFMNGEDVKKIKIMKYIYYKLWQDFTGNVRDNTPAFLSMLWLSFIQCTNIIAFLILINHYQKLKIFYLNKNELVTYSSVFALCMITLNYFLFYKKRELIAIKYKNESKRMKIIGTILLYVYMVGSFILVYAVSKTFPVK